MYPEKPLQLYSDSLPPHLEVRLPLHVGGGDLLVDDGQVGRAAGYGPLQAVLEAAGAGGGEREAGSREREGQALRSSYSSHHG